MTTTRVMTTALPHSLAADADHHLAAFVTHKLTPDAAGAQLAQFPAAADWPATLAAGTWELVTDAVADPIPLSVVPGPTGAPDPVTWAAVFPGTTPVAGFPAPAVSAAPWSSFPAHRLSDHAVDLHIASLSAAPTNRPGVLANPALTGIYDRMAQASDALQVIRRLAQERATRADRLLQRRAAEARVSLGMRQGRLEQGYQSVVDPQPSALEVLLDDEGLDARVTALLDAELGRDHGADPETALLVDAHAARRYYDRPEEQTPYAREPTPGATTPRPDPPTPDFHARAASFGSTPSLVRRLGLAVHLRLAEEHRGLLADATWVAVRFVPGADADVTRLAPPRTRVVVDGDRFEAASTKAWVSGAVPLGEAGYVLLDLDPDASGLKLDQHLRGLPRAAAAEANGDPATSAPGSLRCSGFAIARTDRVAATRARAARAETMTTPDDADGALGPELLYDDLVRGLRLEVWDDRSRAWHSLHERLVTVQADPGGGPVDVLVDVADVGFLQLSGLNRVPGSDANPYYLHEVLAGWDGWSLSAPRPGRVIVHREDGTEHVVDEPPDDPATGVSVRTRVRPGSLPRLRWGTAYSFRLLGVDLAGGSVPRPADLGPGEAPPSGAVDAARGHLDRLARQYARRDDSGFLAAVRDRIQASLPDLDDVGSWAVAGAGNGEEEEEPPRGIPEGSALPDLARTGEPTIDRFLEEQVAAGQGRRGTGPPPAGRQDRAAEPSAARAFAQVAQATRVLMGDRPGSWRVRPQLRVAVDDLVAAMGPPQARGPAAGPVVTAPRPYLRWAPVPPPTLVAQKALTTGEQLSRLVVRSGLPPQSADAATETARHVVPPKTTQLDAETAGCFDEAIGSTDAARQRAAYAVALAERGTLLDEVIPSLEDATATRTQPAIMLAARPGADPAAAVTLAQITAQRDTPLGEGQYVVHGVDDLVLPYLPDPHAAGVALVFYDAGAPHQLADPRPLQSVVLPFPGDWPRVEPLRLVLSAGAALGARLDGRAIRVTLPEGEQVRVAMSSSLRTADLEQFGLWRSHLASTIDPDGDGGATPADVVAAAVLLRAAAAGWTWWLTPSVDLRLVHAVPRPARVPQLLSLSCLVRPPGLTVALLGGIADVHGPSTERLVVRATWTEWVDDVAAPGPVQVERSDVVVNSPVGGTQRWGLLWMLDFQPFGTSAGMTALADGNIGMHRAVATFADTHRRSITCTPSGLTRYAEFFAPDELPAPESADLAGAPVVVEVPSSARPAAPEVVDAVPLLRWDERTEPDQPFALRRVRRSGVRIWLRRPWYSSGDGELLGVVLAGDDGGPDSAVSLWGRDPVYHGPTIANGAAPPLVEAPHLLLERVAGQVVPRPARPVLPAAPVPLVDVADTPTAKVLAYRPEYHPGRGQWFVDVAMDDGPALWPFVRLAVARYQPSSIEGCLLSPVGLTSWVQPLPTRTATVGRPDDRHVRVTVTGTVAFLRIPRRGDHDQEPEDIPGEELDADSPTGELLRADDLVGRTRIVRATVQRLPEGASDLQWEDVSRRRLRVVGVGTEANFRVTWSGELPLGDPVEVRTPGPSSRLRVVVEEEELLDADAADPQGPQGPTVLVPRTVYADIVAL